MLCHRSSSSATAEPNRVAKLTRGSSQRCRFLDVPHECAQLRSALVTEPTHAQQARAAHPPSRGRHRAALVHAMYAALSRARARVSCPPRARAQFRPPIARARARDFGRPSRARDVDRPSRARWRSRNACPRGACSIVQLTAQRGSVCFCARKRSVYRDVYDVARWYSVLQ